ncbi:WXG100 family type VII secretion target [Gordonia sp. Z-3]|jgi:WXG100 family type VII secretion target|uniref:ESAT-6-like protein n=2 Tax=Gordonia TaxID=2053 RepID=A0A9X3D3N2_9ACTN|nr:MULTISPECIES: WXG100 family type VII secretion target [Gordonia]MAU84385.1 WXG100 family type VII secretion target [Gordonia sp. (in: high G+C Gram-positive bacteria)]MCF3940276.1 WXG100 family type VII secretion target [Gordonia tangerina]MCX2964464.1 WXG100 family type VII secretion target [Gordonia aquimaris]MED5799581.1 WXG100 family type VII secretion target [Gordonia sp. Z-3]
MAGEGSGLNLDVVAAQASSQSIAGIVEQMRGILRQIESSAQSGMATWGGTAAKSYNTTQTDWSGTAQKLQAALDEIEGKLTTGFKGYAEHDEDIAQAITSSVGHLKL